MVSLGGEIQKDSGSSVLRKSDKHFPVEQARNSLKKATWGWSRDEERGFT